jgi:hypothetical protein
MGQQLQSINDGIVSLGTSASNLTLNAAFTGSVDTSICRFNAAATTAGDISETTTVADGTIVLISAPGLYHVAFSFTGTGAVNIAGGISFGAATAVAIVADPVVNVANVVASADIVSIAANIQEVTLSGVFEVTAAAVALGAGTGAGAARVMFHATNSAGAVPVGIAVASAQYRIIKIGEFNG